MRFLLIIWSGNKRNRQNDPDMYKMRCGRIKENLNIYVQTGQICDNKKYKRKIC